MSSIVSNSLFCVSLVSAGLGKKREGTGQSSPHTSERGLHVSAHAQHFWSSQPLARWGFISTLLMRKQVQRGYGTCSGRIQNQICFAPKPDVFLSWGLYTCYLYASHIGGRFQWHGPQPSKSLNLVMERECIYLFFRNNDWVALWPIQLQIHPFS